MYIRGEYFLVACEDPGGLLLYGFVFQTYCKPHIFCLFVYPNMYLNNKNRYNDPQALIRNAFLLFLWSSYPDTVVAFSSLFRLFRLDYDCFFFFFVIYSRCSFVLFFLRL